MKDMENKILTKCPLLAVALMHMRNEAYGAGKPAKFKKVWNPKKQEYEYVEEEKN